MPICGHSTAQAPKTLARFCWNHLKKRKGLRVKAKTRNKRSHRLTNLKPLFSAFKTWTQPRKSVSMEKTRKWVKLEKYWQVRSQGENQGGNAKASTQTIQTYSQLANKKIRIIQDYEWRSRWKRNWRNKLYRTFPKKARKTEKIER